MTDRPGVIETFLNNVKQRLTSKQGTNCTSIEM